MEVLLFAIESIVPKWKRHWLKTLPGVGGAPVLPPVALPPVALPPVELPPVAFPPVYFDVEVDGRHFDEMHADGGVMSQVFGAMFLGRLKEMRGASEGRLYLVRNSQLRPEWKAVQPKLVSIAGRTVSTLIVTQGFGDLYRAYLAAQAGNMDFNLAAIPRDFDVPREGEFDPVFMRALFDRGYEQARGGYPWAKVPPGFESMKR